MTGENTGPLAGVKIVELGHVMAGPVCGLMLADMGADVIKVERVAGGDESRQDTEYTIGGESASFMIVNRNKRGIVVDLKSDSGKNVLHRLLTDADGLIENYRHGVMERLGFGYETLRQCYPRLVYCSLSGFGRTGPYADRGGFDLVAQGMSGLMSYTGEGPGRPPVKCGAPVTDIGAGILGALGMVAALLKREQTGRGQMVDTSLFETGITFGFWQAAITFATGERPQPLGSAHPLDAPYQAFPTSDGWITIGGANQNNWLRLLHVLGATPLAEDPRFIDNTARVKNRSFLEAELSRIFRTRTGAEWLQRLEEAGVPAGPVLSMPEVHEDPQTLARNMVCEVPHNRAGSVKTLGFPVKFSEDFSGPKTGAPVYGEHTRDVLVEHGYSQMEIEALIHEGAVVAGT